VKSVFCDLHNNGLYRSLWFLFEKRLGGTLYRPIGYDWWRNGFWEYSQNPEVVKQYLQFHAEDKDMGDYWECPEGKHNYNHRALTFQQFLAKDIDIVVASVSSHEGLYKRLIDLYKPNAKLIRQAGNINERVNFDVCKNVMASTQLDIPHNTNSVVYHQEFDLDTFCNELPYDGLRITNLMNCYPDSRDYHLWLPYKGALPEFDWKMYGILGHDGIIGRDTEMASAFHNTTFVWHLKFGGDGFGHVIHQAFATGRPPIVKRSYYADKMAGLLMIDDETCIDLETDTFGRNIERIKFWARPENYMDMSIAAWAKFNEVVNYDEEELKIRKFLESLQ